MITIEQVRSAKDALLKDFGPALKTVGNNLSVGIGKNAAGEFAIAARLTNDNLKSILPSTYQGVEVQVEVVGPIYPL